MERGFDMLTLHQQEIDYWLNVCKTTNNRLLKRVAYREVLQLRLKLNRFRKLTKS